MGSISTFNNSINGRNSTALLSILSRISLMGLHGLAGDRILAVVGIPYYSSLTRNSRKGHRTSETSKKFLAELVGTGFVVRLDRSTFATAWDIPKFALTEKGRSKLVSLKEEFDRSRTK